MAGLVVAELAACTVNGASVSIAAGNGALANLKRAAQNAALSNPRINPVMANPPTVTVSTTPPSVTGLTFSAAIVPDLFQISGGNVIPFNTFGTTISCVAAEYNAGGQYTYFRVRAVYDSAKIIFLCQSTATPVNMRVIINGQYVSMTPTISGSGPNVFYVTVDFTAVGGRSINDITIEGCPYFFGAYVGPTETVMPCGKDKLRAFMVTDSYGYGGGELTFTSTSMTNTMFDAYNYIAADLLGFTDLWSNSIGGSGYVAGTPFTSRISDIAGSEADVVMYCGGYNDTAETPAAITAAALECFQGARAALPLAPIIVFGVFAGTLNATPGAIAAETAIQAAVTQFADPSCFFIPANSDPSGPWFTGTGYAGAPTNVGNCDDLIFTDGIHPTLYGHQYLARRVVNAVRNLLTSLKV